jgi:DNA-binding transcriptional regulator GbsR (MarR family)
MLSPAINTVIKMSESLAEDKQDKIVEHLKEYIQDLQDEQKWNNYFNKTQDKLIAAVKLAKQKIAEEKATTIDYNKL